MFELGAEEVCVHPDGMHTKQFDICGWLKKEGFEKIAAKGKTREAGTYTHDRQALVVEFQPRRGDVVADVQGCHVVVEAKGGIVNTRHPGQKSKLRKHLYEAVGMLLDGPDNADRLIAAVPRHPETEKIANRMAERCRDAGIKLLLSRKRATFKYAREIRSTWRSTAPRFTRSGMAMSTNVTPLQLQRAAMRDVRPLRCVRVRLLDGEEIEFMGHVCQYGKARAKTAARQRRPGMLAMFWRAWRRW